MKLFYTNASAKEEVGQLETRIQSLEADGQAAASEITQLQADLATATENLSTVTAERDQARADLETANASLAAKETELTAAKQAVVDFDAKVSTAVQAQFASLGGKDPIASSKEDEEQSKAGLSGLTGHARVSAAFAKKK